jgi:hypothetical protein
VDSPGSEQGPLAGSPERADEPSGSGARELVSPCYVGLRRSVPPV